MNVRGKHYDDAKTSIYENIECKLQCIMDRVPSGMAPVIVAFVCRTKVKTDRVAIDFWSFIPRMQASIDPREKVVPLIPASDGR